MKEYIDQLKRKNDLDLDQYFIALVTARVDRYVDLCTQVRRQVDDVSGKEIGIRKQLEVCRSLNRLITAGYIIDEMEQFRNTYPSYHYAIESSITFLPSVLVEEQSMDRFRSLKSDSFYVRLAKVFKQIGLFSHRTARRVANFFGTQYPTDSYWNHSIHLRSLARYVLKVELTKGLENVLFDHELQLAEGLFAFNKQLETTLETALRGADCRSTIEQLDLELERIARLSEQASTDIKNQQKLAFTKLDHWAARVGTLELANVAFHDAKTNRKFAKEDERYAKKMKMYQRSHQVIKGDWTLKLQLEAHFLQIKRAAQFVLDRIESRTEREINDELNKIASFITELQEKTESCAAAKSASLELLKGQRIKNTSELKAQMVPEIVRVILYQNLPGLLLQFEKTIDESLQNVLDKVFVAKGFDPNEPLSGSDIKSFNPRMVVQETCLPEVRESINTLEQQLFVLNNRLQPTLLEITNILVYTVESALNSLESESRPLKEVNTGLEEGIERAWKRLKALQQEYIKLHEEAKLRFDEMLDAFWHRLDALGNTENALELNFNLMRIKAKAQTKGYWQRSVFELRKIWRFASLKFKVGWQKALGVYKETENTFNQSLPEVKRADLNRLTDVTQVYEKLPFIYDLLFRPKPLEDFTFYIKRTREETLLLHSFEAWKEGREASVLVTGPKGAGLSSLFNYFVSENLKDLTLNRVGHFSTIASPVQLLDILKKTFNYSKVETLEELASKVNECDFRRVVYVDELQNYFLREVGGFDVLKELINFMALTKKNVFWICTLTETAYQYLERTVSISSRFTKVIELQPFSKEELQSFLFSRHQVSGYDLVFNWPELLQNRKTRKLGELERNEFFKKSFAETIWKESEGSLYLALLLWTMSIETIDQQTVRMKPAQMETRVVKTLNDRKLTIMHMLLLHDGLELHHLAKTSGFTLTETKALLHSLVKDGLVLQFNDFFASNLLLYRTLVRTLKSKNILH